jgi:hypothetical protein
MPGERTVPDTSQQQDPDVCPICLDVDNGMWAAMSRCGHRFHEQCIRRWRRDCRYGASRCPVCRTDGGLFVEFLDDDGPIPDRLSDAEAEADEEEIPDLVDSDDDDEPVSAEFMYLIFFEYAFGFVAENIFSLFSGSFTFACDL